MRVVDRVIARYGERRVEEALGVAIIVGLIAGVIFVCWIRGWLF